jgi:hypothetical protein
MFPIIEQRTITVWDFGKKYLNICLGKDDKEIAYFGMGYYYLSKDGKRLTRIIYTLS